MEIILTVVAAYVASKLFLQTNSTLNQYVYMTYYQDTALLPLSYLVTIVPMIFGSLLLKPMVKKFGKKNLVTWPLLGSAAKILTWEAAIVALRPILLTIVVNIPLMALMLDAGGISAADFIAKRLPLLPAILLFVAVIGFVALAYYLGGKKICSMNLAETIKDDTFSM